MSASGSLAPADARELAHAYTGARKLVEQAAAEFSPVRCRYCGKAWQLFNGSTLDGHARCTVGDEFKQWLLAWKLAHPLVRDTKIAACLGISEGTLRAWISPRALETMSAGPKRASWKQQKGARRSLSVNGEIFERLRKRAAVDGRSLSSIVEELLATLTSADAQRAHEYGEVIRARASNSPDPNCASARAARAIDRGEIRLRDTRKAFGVTPQAVVNYRKVDRNRAGLPPVERTSSTPGRKTLEERARMPVPVAVSRATYDAVEDSLARSRAHVRLRDVTSEFDAALVRLLDAYESAVAKADACAICRSRTGPFHALLAGDSGVVARCAQCQRERRGLSGLVDRRAV